MNLIGEWTEIAQLVQPASSVSATALGDRVFIYGGEKSDRTDSCVVQCYDTNLKTVSVIASELPVNCKLSRAVMCDSNSYLILFDGKVRACLAGGGGCFVVALLSEHLQCIMVFVVPSLSYFYTLCLYISFDLFKQFSHLF